VHIIFSTLIQAIAVAHSLLVRLQTFALNLSIRSRDDHRRAENTRLEAGPVDVAHKPRTRLDSGTRGEVGHFSVVIESPKSATRYTLRTAPHTSRFPPLTQSEGRQSSASTLAPPFFLPPDSRNCFGYSVQGSFLHIFVYSQRAEKYVVLIAASRCMKWNIHGVSL
jgi:hypothetical protein